jgi:transposase
MFQDEGRFGRINEPRNCWAPDGVRPATRCQIVREYTHAYAAVCPHDGTMDSLILPDADGVSMSIFLAEVARRHAEEIIVMVMDGASWHSSADLAIPANLRILHLPPYSPELNPAEHIWDEMREKWFSNKVFKDMNGVESVLVESLLHLENDKALVKSLCGFKWIVNCEV